MRLSPSAAFVVAAAALLAARVEAAVLSFDAVQCESPPVACANGLAINQATGDIAGELDVVYTNRVGPGNAAPFSTNLSGIRWFNTGYGDLAGVAWGRGDDGVAEIALLPAPGYQVTLTGFDLGSFSADVNTQYTVYDGNYTPLASSGPLSLDAFGTAGRIRYSYAFDLTSANGLIVQWGPDSSSVALDNLAFGVTAVPAPGSLALLLTAVGGALAWRRRPAPA